MGGSASWDQVLIADLLPLNALHDTYVVVVRRPRCRLTPLALVGSCAPSRPRKPPSDPAVLGFLDPYGGVWWGIRNDIDLR